MLSDIVTNKSDAKNEIRGALIGLLLIISAVLVLDVINPDIKTNQVNFSEIKSFDPNASTTSGIRAVTPPTVADPAAKPVIEFSLTSHGKLVWDYDPSNEYATYTGNLLVYNATEQCTKEAEPGDDFRECMNQLRIVIGEPRWDDAGDTEGFCTHNGGKFSSTQTTYNCLLPTWSKKHTEIKDAYLNTLPPTATTVWDLAAVTAACSFAGGELVDIEKSTLYGLYDYRCVKY